MESPKTNGQDDNVQDNNAADADAPRWRGPIAFMASNGVAANLLMVFLVAAGVFALSSIVQEVFPEFSLDAVQIRVPYPGATPEEVEESIVKKIEEQIEAVEGIKEITAVAAEGVGTVTAELTINADVGRALDDIKAEVDRITTFPEQAERPEVRELTNRQSAIRIALYGDADERSIKELAYRVEDEIGALPPVSYVQASDIRQYEISIDVSRDALRAYGLTLPQVARIVGQSSLDLSAGTVETSEEEIRVRTLGQNYVEQDFANIVLLSREDGTTIRLGQVAEVRDGFEDADLITRYNGQRAAFVEVYRTSDERVLEIVEAVTAYLENDLAPNLPYGLDYSIWENDAQILQDRVDLLMKNAMLGLALVLIALTLFLNLRLAFWTAIGIGISFVGTLAIMYVLGVSINQLSLFGFILAIGIVVDDAIVVGENIFAEREKGRSGLAAAVAGAQRIAKPVTFAILTTIVAFTPLLFVPGTIGKIMKAIPIVVISVLALSLIEALFILPHHLSGLGDRDEESKNRVARFFDKLQAWVDKKLRAFVEGPLASGLRFATARPTIIVAAGLALIVLSVATIRAGYVPVQFFPSVEADVVTASLEMPQGTAIEVTQRVAERLEAAGRTVADSLEADRPDDRPPLVEALYTSIGRGPQGGGPDGGGTTRLQANQAAVQVKLLSADRRELSSKAFENRWRDVVGEVPEARSLSFSSSLIDVGAPVNIELSDPSPQALSGASQRVMERLREFQGVFDIESDESQGLREIQLRLKPLARTFGLTLSDLAGQVRAAFFGDEALRVQRGREDVRVYVRLPERERDTIADVEAFRIRTPSGGEIPLRQVADVDFGLSPSSIQRKDGQRVVTITADVNPSVVTGQEVTAQLEGEILPEVQRDYPDLTYTFGGEQEQQRDSFGALARGFGLALFGIFALLAIPFRSYLQPLVIMAAIPFGIIGAVIGHLLLGLSIGLLSIFGIIGLSGVVVNDSLVMIDFINERRLAGAAMRDAIIEGAQARFRPILLTSITTFLGVAPLVFEQSLQAQFLVPMAASIGFGIVFATAILMLLVPALAMLHYRVEVFFQKRILGRADEDIEVVHGSQTSNGRPGDERAMPATQPAAA